MRDQQKPFAYTKRNSSDRQREDKIGLGLLPDRSLLMLPMTFNRKVLETLFTQERQGVQRVISILHMILMKRVVPYFKKRGTEPTLLARISQNIAIQRLEDEEDRIHVVSLLLREQDGGVVGIHERIFDYLAFVIPSDPTSRLGGGTSEEGKMLAFSEFLLRHQMEHLLYLEKTEREVIRTDVVFAMDRRSSDPTYYKMLRIALGDEMNGLEGVPYLGLFDTAEQDRSFEDSIISFLNPFPAILAEMPEHRMGKAFLPLDRELKTRVLGELYRRSRDTSYSLVRRNAFLQEVLNLFALLAEGQEEDAEGVFNAFKERWGLVSLLHELDLPEATLEGKDARQVFSFFKSLLKKTGRETPSPPLPRIRVAEPEPKEKTRSLSDRIEEARKNQLFPRQALDIIDKNKMNAVGHSGPKYSELIETLLAIPWGRFEKISVSPETFEEGLNRSHYGLEKPKDMLCDFFTNLIWRYENNPQEMHLSMHRTGSAFLLVGPPGVGKTSLAVSVAQNLGIGYHKISLGGMRDEADLRGHGFTYEGSKPGAIVQGLIKMGIMNGMFIMDEADKTEKFAIATLLEILDPEQNHLFHDRYIETTLDIDLSNCHFLLTANTLETVPPPVVNRCEVIFLDRYSMEEKIAIARQYLIPRLRERYEISEKEILFDPSDAGAELLRHLIKTYTREAGVRELERILRTLFLRILRKEILARGEHGIKISREKVKQYLAPPSLPRQINEESRVGEMLALGVDAERGVGSIIPVQATPIRLGGEGDSRQRTSLSIVHATGNIQTVMDESRKVATTGILHCADTLGIDRRLTRMAVHLHLMGGSTRKDGPSAGGAIALALASVFSNRALRRDVAMTGEIDTQGRITGVGGLHLKLETALDAGCKTVLIPKENLSGPEGMERLPSTLKSELQILTYEEWKGEHPAFDYRRHLLQVVAVDHIVQAADVAFLEEAQIKALEDRFVPYAHQISEALRSASLGGKVCVLIFYVKDPNEFETAGMESPMGRGCNTIMVHPSELGGELRKRWPVLPSCMEMRTFNPSVDSLARLARDVQNSMGVPSNLPQVSVVAPFFFIKRDGIRPEKVEKCRLFANNFTVQGVKVKTCKNVLNRVYRHLAVLDPEDLQACPFLQKKDDIYTVDLSFIPEKYRLDVKYAEEVLVRCLKRWLKVLESLSESRRDP
jgi:endopeptidase La